MEVNVHIGINDIIHISAAGEIDTREKTQCILGHLDKSPEGRIFITFLDANIIHRSIIKKLHGLQRQGRIKVFVLKPYLYSYLSKLGIRAKYMPRNSATPMGLYQEPRISQDIEEEQVMEFLQDINRCYGYDYTGYQIASIMRRIRISMLRENIKNFGEFADCVMKSEELFEQLFLSHYYIHNLLDN